MTRQCQCAGCVAFARTGQGVNVDRVSSAQVDTVSSPYEYVEALRVRQDGKCSCGKCEHSAPPYEGEHATGTLRAGLYEYAMCACGWQWEADDADSATERARLHQAWYSR